MMWMVLKMFKTEKQVERAKDLDQLRGVREQIREQIQKLEQAVKAHDNGD